MNGATEERPVFESKVPDADVKIIPVKSRHDLACSSSRLNSALLDLD